MLNNIVNNKTKKDYVVIEIPDIYQGGYHQGDYHQDYPSLISSTDSSPISSVPTSPTYSSPPLSPIYNYCEHKQAYNQQSSRTKYNKRCQRVQRVNTFISTHINEEKIQKPEHECHINIGNIENFENFSKFENINNFGVEKQYIPPSTKLTLCNYTSIFRNYLGISQTDKDNDKEYLNV